MEHIVLYVMIAMIAISSIGRLMAYIAHWVVEEMNARELESRTIVTRYEMVYDPIENQYR